MEITRKAATVLGVVVFQKVPDKGHDNAKSCVVDRSLPKFTLKLQFNLQTVSIVFSELLKREQKKFPPYRKKVNLTKQKHIIKLRTTVSLVQ